MPKIISVSAPRRSLRTTPQTGITTAAPTTRSRSCLFQEPFYRRHLQKSWRMLEAARNFDWTYGRYVKEFNIWSANITWVNSIASWPQQLLRRLSHKGCNCQPLISWWLKNIFRHATETCNRPAQVICIPFSITFRDCSSGALDRRERIYRIRTRETSMVSIAARFSILRMNANTAPWISASISCSRDAPALITAAKTYQSTIT